MIRRHWICICRYGTWPLCGIGRRCGEWEYRARVAGILIEEHDKLPHGLIFSAEGKPPIIYLPGWLGGKVRDAEIARLLCVLALRQQGEGAVQAQINALVEASIPN